jgi:hypothetical protein
MMDHFQHKKDAEGKYWFAIPVHDSSREDEVLQLEKIIFRDWLKQENFTSEELLWLLDYSCRDDYGLGIDYVSAWAEFIISPEEKQLEQKIQRSGFYMAGRKCKTGKTFFKIYKRKIFTESFGF